MSFYIYRIISENAMQPKRITVTIILLALLLALTAAVYADSAALSFPALSLTLTVGQTLDFPASGSEEILYYSDDENTLSIDEHGTLCAKKIGTAVIYAAAEGLPPASCIVSVKAADPLPLRELSMPAELALTLGETMLLPITALPAEATEVVLLSSSDPNIAAVDQYGCITTRAVGECVITAANQSGTVKSSCRLRVLRDRTVKSLTFASDSLTLHVGQTRSHFFSVKPDDADLSAVEFVSDSPEIAEVSAGGTITAVSPGTAVITADFRGKPLDYCYVFVLEPMRELRFAEDKITMKLAEEKLLRLIVTPISSDDNEYRYQSSNTGVAAVAANGTITAKGIGKAVITVTSTTCGLSAEAEVDVIDTSRKSFGDITLDGLINSYDLTLLLQSYGTTNEKCDINGDGAVNSADLTKLLQNYGKSD